MSSSFLIQATGQRRIPVSRPVDVEARRRSNTWAVCCCTWVFFANTARAVCICLLLVGIEGWHRWYGRATGLQTHRAHWSILKSHCAEVSVHDKGIYQRTFVDISRNSPLEEICAEMQRNLVRMRSPSRTQSTRSWCRPPGARHSLHRRRQVLID